MSKVYISGPMTGIPKFNRPAFIKAKAELSVLGYDVVSPVDIGDSLPGKPTWKDYMKADIKALVDCELIYMLEGWEKSKGARIEWEVAKLFDIDPLYL